MSRNIDVSEKIAQALKRDHYSVSIAESVTAGMLQHRFSAMPGAMSFFEGGITTYTLKQKNRFLGIDPAEALSCQCVSAPIAEKMAESVRELFLTDWGFSITGFATYEEVKDGPYAFFAAKFRDARVFSTCLRPPEGITPEEIREYYCERILEIMLERLEENARP